MQVSAINLIIAAQQVRGASDPRPPAQANTPETGAPKISNSAAPSSDFAPLTFGSQAVPAQRASSSATPAGYPANAPLGSQIDIRV